MGGHLQRPGAALVWLASVNVVLAMFNLLPGAPLDGGRLLRAVIWWRYQDRDRAAVLAARGAGPRRYLDCNGVFGALAGLGTGLWLALVGWFILSGARAEQAAAGDEHLAGLKVADVMTPVSVLAPAGWSVERCVAHLSPTRIAAGAFPVVDLAGHTVGVFTLGDLEAVPARHRVDTKLEALAARRVFPVVLTPDGDAAEIAAQIRLHGGIAVVEEENHPVGVVTALDLGRAAHLTALGWRTAPHRP